MMIGRFVAVVTVALVLLVTISSAADQTVIDQILPACPAVRCPANCVYGNVVDENGCKTCECLNACVNMKCGSNETCAAADPANAARLDAVQCYPSRRLCCPCVKLYWPYNYVQYANCCPLGCKIRPCPPGMICCPNQNGCLTCVWPVRCW